MRADLDWTARRALQIRGLDFRAHSRNGLALEGVESIAAKIFSTKTWVKTVERTKTRLAPFAVDFSFENTARQRSVGFSGALDYDGLVPGGTIQGLKAKGGLDIRLRGGGFVMDFLPETPVSLTRFTNASGWTVKNARFNIADGRKILQRRGAARPLSSRLVNVRADVSSPDGGRNLSMQFTQIDIQSDFSKQPQIWSLDYKDMRVRSEDFPSPGTRVQSPAGTLVVTQHRDGQMEFQARTPNTKIKTENVRINQVSLNVYGRPDDFTLDYDAPRVKFMGGNIPILPMVGTARMTDNVLHGEAQSELPLTKDMPMIITFSSKDGQGHVNIKMDRLEFDPRGLQPQHLAPALKGKIADVSGAVSLDFDFDFGGGVPMSSRGIVALDGLNVGTLVGPFSGIDANLQFSSFFPPKTKGVQTVHVAGFDPGFPLENGTIVFEIIPGGIRIDKAFWPVEIAGEPIGSISIDPLEWRFGNVENRMTVRVDNISLKGIMDEIGKGKVQATGQISGTLPVVVKGVNVNVENGVLRVKDGGTIQYHSRATDAAGTRNEMAGKAFEALKDFKYKELEMRIDGPLDGKMSLRLAFDGKNENVLGGQPYSFNIVFDGELANLARNLAKSFNNYGSIDELLSLGQSLRSPPKQSN
ncbi:MAG TPA: hypothetical protein ENJ42_07715 [Hellea balneolensis]|uniref:Uncharacterized protein n=1 Tax=Hellea balneolensis TaxID=287478 RepID=A0A7C5R7R7_9PROT|nr:hypothetical protein [Hellea balneolensis]